LVWAKNPSPQTWSYLWNGVLRRLKVRHAASGSGWRLPAFRWTVAHRAPRSPTRRHAKCQSGENVHIERRKDIVQCHPPAPGQLLALADGPGLDHVEEAKSHEDGQCQRPSATTEKVFRPWHGAMFGKVFTDPSGKTDRQSDDFIQHDRAGVGLAQDFFRRAAEPDGQENSGHHCAGVHPVIAREEEQRGPKHSDRQTERAGSHRDPPATE